MNGVIVFGWMSLEARVRKPIRGGVWKQSAETCGGRPRRGKVRRATARLVSKPHQMRVRTQHMLNPSELRLMFLVDVRETAWRAAFSDELSVAGDEGKALKTTKPKGVPA